MELDNFQILLSFFKALGNESRLKIIALLADRDCTVGELARILQLKEPTVSEHLALLREVDLVTVRSEGNFRIYSFNGKALHMMNRDLFSQERLAALVEDDDQQILSHYLDGERLTTIPANRKKLRVVLAWLAEKFEPDRQYAENEVNQILRRHHEDYATLRRELIGHQFMQREKSIYWRIPPQA